MQPFVIAHEQWFVTSGEIAAQTKDPFFTSWNDVNLAYALAAIGILIGAIVIHFLIRNTKWMNKLRKKLETFGSLSPTIARVFTGLFIISWSLYIGWDFFSSSEWWSTKYVLLAAMIIGFFITTGIFVRFMSLIGILILGAMFYVDIAWNNFSFSFLPYLFIPGILVFLILQGTPEIPRIKAWFRFRDSRLAKKLDALKPYALPVLRISVGLSLVGGALFNKLLYPQPALAFLEKNAEIFHSIMDFFNMTNAQFVFAAGLCELLLGALILFGFLTRLCGLKLLFIFILGIATFGLIEFFGHLPLIAAAYAFLTLGGGEKWSFEK